MKKLFTVLSLFISQISFGQTRHLNIYEPTSDERYKMKHCDMFSVIDEINEPEKIHIRFKDKNYWLILRGKVKDMVVDGVCTPRETLQFDNPAMHDIDTAYLLSQGWSLPKEINDTDILRHLPIWDEGVQKLVQHH